MSLEKLFQKLKGGKGSGNWGHAGRKGRHGGSSSGKSINFNLSLENEEIKKLKQQIPEIKPKIIKLSKSVKDQYVKQYNFWIKQDSLDKKRINSILSKKQVPPLIGKGTEDDFYITDGSHRLAIAAHQNKDTVAIYLEQ